MKKRKNRLVIELTTSEPMTQKAARYVLELLLKKIALKSKSIPQCYAQKLTVKEYSRVVASDLNKHPAIRNMLEGYGHPAILNMLEGYGS